MHPDWTPGAVRAFLKSTAEPIGSRQFSRRPGERGRRQRSSSFSTPELELSPVTLPSRAVSFSGPRRPEAVPGFPYFAPRQLLELAFPSGIEGRVDPQPPRREK